MLLIIMLSNYVIKYCNASQIKFKLSKEAAFMITGPDRSFASKLENKYNIAIDIENDIHTDTEELIFYLSGKFVILY